MVLTSDKIKKGGKEPKKPKTKKGKEEIIPELILGKEKKEEVKEEEPFFPIRGPIRLESISGLFGRVGSAPTHTPRNFQEQFVLFETGGDYRLYIYIKDAWRYINTTS